VNEQVYRFFSTGSEFVLALMGLCTVIGIESCLDKLCCIVCVFGHCSVE